MNTDLERRKTVYELAAAWQEGMRCLREGLELVRKAEEHLKAFSGGGRAFGLDCFTPTHWRPRFDEKELRLRAEAWRYLVDRIELKKFASVKKAKEIDRQLDDPKELPDITVDNIMAWLANMSGQADDMRLDAVREVFDLLRRHAGYKTNSAFKVNTKVILSYPVEQRYRGKSFWVSPHYDNELRALDNVFHMLDGAGSSAYRQGELHAAIESSPDGTGETTYFRFKCYKIGTLHIWFKRPGLVELLNRTGGNVLPSPLDNPPQNG